MTNTKWLEVRKTSALKTKKTVELDSRHHNKSSEPYLREKIVL